MDVFDIDGIKPAIYGFFAMLGIGAIKMVDRVVMAQRERDKTVTALKEEMAAYKLSVSDEYARKTEIARLHDRIDGMDKKVDGIHAILIDLPQKVATIVKKP